MCEDPSIEWKTMDAPDGNFGYFDDDGNRMNPNLIPKPSLCVSCAKDGDPGEEILCNLNRLGQQDEEEFKCFAYLAKSQD